MNLKEHITFKSPVLRVNNRDRNIAFYKESLGLKLVSEENAIAFFSAWDNPNAHFAIEESPSMRTRAANGITKLNKIIIKALKASDIEALLANGAAAQQVFQGKNGYAYETLSPEGHLFLLHAEDELTDLVEIDRPELPEQPDFKGLSDFVYDAIVLNVLDVAESAGFDQDLFGEQAPIAIDFVKAVGGDLAIEPNETWDIEILEFQVTEDFDLAQYKADLEAKGYQVYLDKKERILVVSTPSKIEVWFSK